ncbi:hypothetical protein K438DRAFT_1981802 [Mycena galopus ATCC 62051]|nr:hypothetical protein K438DRAFT_1981802 [Mycena galopus ATCC 62051]
MPLVWDQLTHLTLQSSGEHRGFLFHNVVYILGRCKRLISFHVSVRKPNLTIASPLESIMMSFLETLVMDGSLAPTFLNHLIEYVSMPRLRQFSVVKLRGSGNLSLGGLGTGSPHIEYLSNISLSDLTAAETLRPFSALVKLVVSDDYNGNTTQFLNLLTPGLNPEVLCPMLQELVISFCCGLNKPTLDAFVRGRIELAQGFRRLEFENPMDWTLSQDELKSILSKARRYQLFTMTLGLKPPPPGQVCRRTAHNAIAQKPQ